MQRRPLVESKSESELVSFMCRSTQLLTWILIPLSSGFFDAGDFTFLSRPVLDSLSFASLFHSV